MNRPPFQNTHKYLLYIVLCLSFLLNACQEEVVESPDSPEAPETPDPPSTSKALLTFSFLAENNPKYLKEDFSYDILGDRINAMLPPGQQYDSLVASFTTDAAVVMVDSTVQVSDSTANDFTQPITYRLIAEDSSTADYQINVHTTTGLPIVYINTENSAPITSKDDYINGALTLIANDRGEEPLTDVEMEIRGRGNSTWRMPKKPYRIKFDDKTELLGMPADKSWVLLANFSDKTLMRNHIAFEMSRRFGLAYTPQSHFVELYLNGNYEGNYLLTEQIQVDKHRLNINELDESDISEEVITGGYLLEVDGRKDADHWFNTGKGEPFTIKSPKNITPEQLAYIQNYIQATEDAIFSENFADPQEGYAQYIDTESFIDWYLVNEITKNTDAIFNLSVYLYKPRGEKLFMGPVWDFDIGLGNVNYSPGEFAEGWHIRNAPWFRRLFEDPAFSQRVKDRWNELKDNEIKAVLAEVDETASYLAVSQAQNFRRWNILNKAVWPNPVVTGSYEGEVQYMKEWLTTRIDWMDNAINQ